MLPIMRWALYRETVSGLRFHSYLAQQVGLGELSILLLVTGPLALWRAARKVTHLVVFPWVAPLVSGVYLPKSDVRLLEFGEETDHQTEPNSTPNGEYIFHIYDIGIAYET